MLAFRIGALLLLLSVQSHAAANEAKVNVRSTPLSKVIELLNGMLEKGKDEKATEEAEHRATGRWCEKVRYETAKAIRAEEERIEKLKAAVAKAISDIQELGFEISDLEDGGVRLQAEKKNQTAHRKKEHMDFVATQQDLAVSIDATARAVQSLKSGAVSQQQEGASLAQLDTSSLPPRAKAALESFMELGSSGESDESALGTPDVNAYEFQSGGVKNMLVQLHEDFKKQKNALEKGEIQSRNSFDELIVRLEQGIAAAKKYVHAKQELKAGEMEKEKQEEQEMNEEEAVRLEDKKKMDLTIADCDAMDREFNKNQEIRAGEITAIEQALEILSSDKVSGNADKHLPASPATSFVQMNRKSVGGRQRLMELLQSRAEKTGSRTLAVIAAHASSDPLGSVKTMIQEMITKLLEEETAESESKGFCDKELAKNKATREDLTAQLDAIHAKIEEMEAQSAQLQATITDVSKQVADIRAQQAEATANREQEKATNQATIKDAKEAQVAVEKASSVLQDFYGKTADGAALIQDGDSQETGAPYKGMQASGGNIVSFLEVITSDFARLESETSSAEDQGASEYEKYMEESATDIQMKEKEVRHKDRSKMHLDEAIIDVKKDSELTQDELDKNMNYYDKLKPDCLDTGLSYDDRKASREEEISSLQEALKVFGES